MSCFDTVEFKCPNCGWTNSLQTKAGHCNLATYSLHTSRFPPPEIVGSLAMERPRCEECGVEIAFRVQASATPVIYVEDDDG